MGCEQCGLYTCWTLTFIILASVIGLVSDIIPKDTLSDLGIDEMAQKTILTATTITGTVTGLAATCLSLVVKNDKYHKSKQNGGQYSNGFKNASMLGSFIFGSLIIVSMILFAFGGYSTGTSGFIQNFYIPILMAVVGTMGVIVVGVLDCCISSGVQTPEAVDVLPEIAKKTVDPQKHGDKTHNDIQLAGSSIDDEKRPLAVVTNVGERLRQKSNCESSLSGSTDENDERNLGRQTPSTRAQKTATADQELESRTLSDASETSRSHTIEGNQDDNHSGSDDEETLLSDIVSRSSYMNKMNEKWGRADSNGLKVVGVKGKFRSAKQKKLSPEDMIDLSQESGSDSNAENLVTDNNRGSQNKERRRLNSSEVVLSHLLD